MEELETLEQVLMRRDGVTLAEAQTAISYAKIRVRDGENPKEVLEEEFGLEPDWVFELLEDL